MKLLIRKPPMRSRSDGWSRMLLAAYVACARSACSLHGPPDLLVESHDAEPERLERRRRVGHVVAGLQHLELVARQRWTRQQLEQARVHADEPERDVHRRPAHAEDPLDARVQLVPGHAVGPAELED